MTPEVTRGGRISKEILKNATKKFLPQFQTNKNLSTCSAQKRTHLYIVVNSIEGHMSEYVWRKGRWGSWGEHSFTIGWSH